MTETLRKRQEPQNTVEEARSDYQRVVVNPMTVLHPKPEQRKEIPNFAIYKITQYAFYNGEFPLNNGEKIILDVWYAPLIKGDTMEGQDREFIEDCKRF